MTDLALLRQVADGQAEALGVLYDRYAPTLLALGKRILGSLTDAEEILQEVFLYVWNHAARYDRSRSSVSTWLVLVARSRAIDRLRTRKVVERTHETAHQEAPPGHASPEGLDAVFVRERRERVRGEMDKLPPEQKQVLEMAFYEGLSQSEIAVKADLPLGTVKTRTLLAMKKLRGALRDEIRQLL
ncbi:MAG TPA: sigma-70 family RNA polymerase sigma factor [Thermoanaerobaculia bacterium]|jgi:RNA polymerase sigma-70 factor (ECF subfamily)|nr:sigma-70 family RNA polymerase sigma factor [Thermoanaerobaculia bacterium]